MTTIKFFTRATDNPRVYRVWWGAKISEPRDVFDVTVAPGWDDPAIVAELRAIYEVLVVRKEYFFTRAGRGLDLVVSAGAIKKGWLSASSKTHLIPWVRFLGIGFRYATLSVGKKHPWPDDLTKPSPLSADRPGHLLTPSILGDVVITRHAVQRFEERVGFPSHEAALKGLRSALVATDTWEVKVPEETARKHLEKYGKQARVLMHQGTKCLLVIAPDTIEPTVNKVVTAFCMEVHRVSSTNTG